eukprot:jgi/Mesvir1/10171/Mv26231-RA.4
MKRRQPLFFEKLALLLLVTVIITATCIATWSVTRRSSVRKVEQLSYDLRESLLVGAVKEISDYFDGMAVQHRDYHRLLRTGLVKPSGPANFAVFLSSPLTFPSFPAPSTSLRQASHALLMSMPHTSAVLYASEGLQLVRGHVLERSSPWYMEMVMPSPLVDARGAVVGNSSATATSGVAYVHPACGHGDPADDEVDVMAPTDTPTDPNYILYNSTGVRMQPDPGVFTSAAQYNFSQSWNPAYSRECTFCRIRDLLSPYQAAVAARSSNYYNTPVWTIVPMGRPGEAFFPIITSAMAHAGDRAIGLEAGVTIMHTRMSSLSSRLANSPLRMQRLDHPGSGEEKMFVVENPSGVLVAVADTADALALLGPVKAPIYASSCGIDYVEASMRVLAGHVLLDKSQPCSGLTPLVRAPPANEVLGRGVLVKNMSLPILHASLRLNGTRYLVDTLHFSVEGFRMMLVLLTPWQDVMGDIAATNRVTLRVILACAGAFIALGVVLICIFTRRLTVELKSRDDARSVAEATSRTRAMVLSTISHEIRTPMQAILGLVDILLDESLPPSQLDVAMQIKQCTYALLQLLNNVLDIGKVESGKLVAENTPFPMWDVLENLVEVFAQQKAARALDVALDIAEDVPHVIYSDSLRFRQIWSNLLSNAIKFTEAGHVLLRVRPAPPGVTLPTPPPPPPPSSMHRLCIWLARWCPRLPRFPRARTPHTPGTPTPIGGSVYDAGGMTTGTSHSGSLDHPPPLGTPLLLLFEVEDSGIGITPAQAATLFHAFTQATAGTARKYGGTGLGLSIVKGLVAMMGGAISVGARPGGEPGAVFRVLLPVTPVLQPRQAQREGSTDMSPVGGVEALASPPRSAAGGSQGTGLGEPSAHARAEAGDGSRGQSTDRGARAEPSGRSEHRRSLEVAKGGHGTPLRPRHMAATEDVAPPPVLARCDWPDLSGWLFVLALMGSRSERAAMRWLLARGAMVAQLGAPVPSWLRHMASGVRGDSKGGKDGGQQADCAVATHPLAGTDVFITIDGSRGRCSSGSSRTHKAVGLPVGAHTATGTPVLRSAVDRLARLQGRPWAEWVEEMAAAVAAGQGQSEYACRADAGSHGSGAVMGPSTPHQAEGARDKGAAPLRRCVFVLDACFAPVSSLEPAPRHAGAATPPSVPGASSYPRRWNTMSRVSVDEQEGGTLGSAEAVLEIGVHGASSQEGSSCPVPSPALTRSASGNGGQPLFEAAPRGGHIVWVVAPRLNGRRREQLQQLLPPGTSSVVNRPVYYTRLLEVVKLVQGMDGPPPSGATPEGNHNSRRNEGGGANGRLRGPGPAHGPAQLAHSMSLRHFFSSLDLLVAEDNAMSARVLGAMLAKLGVERVTVASDGDEAVRAYTARANAGPMSPSFSLLLLDYHMPGTTGPEAAARIRALEAERGLGHVPILALTGCTDAAEMEACASAGMDEVLVKPVDLRTLERVLLARLWASDSSARLMSW